MPACACEGKLICRCVLSFQTKPVIDGLRFTPPGPVKLTTSLATSKLPVFIGVLKLKMTLVVGGGDAPEGVAPVMAGSSVAPGVAGRGGAAVGRTAVITLGPPLRLSPQVK